MSAALPLRLRRRCWGSTPCRNERERNKRTERGDPHAKRQRQTLASDCYSINNKSARETLAAREHETTATNHGEHSAQQRAPDGQEGDRVGHDLARVEVEVELGEGVNGSIGPPQDDLVQEAIAAAGNADLEPNRSPTETEELQHEQPNCA